MYLSANGVVLTPGNVDGLVPNSLWSKVVRRRKGLEPAEPASAPEPEVKAFVEDQAVQAAQPEQDASTSKAKKRQGKGGAFKARYIDELIWENGQPVHPPRVVEDAKP